MVTKEKSAEGEVLETSAQIILVNTTIILKAFDQPSHQCTSAALAACRSLINLAAEIQKLAKLTA
jgi:hypothetical protein